MVIAEVGGNRSRQPSSAAVSERPKHNICWRHDVGAPSLTLLRNASHHQAEHASQGLFTSHARMEGRWRRVAASR